jgi:CRP/FNR family cyclic AMP-dependent transcriptional regulator
MIPIDLFAHNAETHRVETGGYLFREGDPGGLMYVLNTGSAEVLVGDRVVETLAHGSIVGEMSLVSPGPHSASVRAISECSFVAVDEKRFHFLVQQTPFFATRVMRVMAERLRATDALLKQG